jgi:hypothetical protein
MRNEHFTGHWAISVILSGMVNDTQVLDRLHLLLRYTKLTEALQNNINLDCKLDEAA